jgi:hypothetical protein
MTKDDNLIGIKIYDDEGKAAGIIKSIQDGSILIEATESFKEKLKETDQLAFSLRTIPKEHEGFFVDGKITEFKLGVLSKIPIINFPNHFDSSIIPVTPTYGNMILSNTIKQLSESERYLHEIFGNNIPLRFMKYINSPIEEVKKKVELFNFLIDIGDKFDNFVSFDFGEDSKIHMHSNEGNVNYNFTKEDAFKIAEVFKEIGEFIEKNIKGEK